MYHGAILRTDRLLNEATEAVPFTGDAVCVFTTDGVQSKGVFRGEKGFFYKNDKAAEIEFFSGIMDMLGEALFEMVGREEFIRIQNATLLRLNEKAKAEACAHEKNL